jgi:hypothetical protein
MQVFTHTNYSTLELRDVSADGQVYMGNGRTLSGCHTTFTWSQALGIAGPLCTPPSGPFVGARLSGDGMAIVGTQTPFRDWGFIWRAASGVQIIMSGCNCGNHHAYGVDHDGDVVVGTMSINPNSGIAGIWNPFNPNGPLPANLYFSMHGIQVPPNYPFQGSRVILTSAAGDAFVVETLTPSTLGFHYVGPCPANCDNSGGLPILTPNDFQCFLDRYASGDTRANCDQVGGLTPNDFQCYLNAYTAGCPLP